MDIIKKNQRKYFYHLEYSHYCLYLYWYIHDILTDASFGLLQVLLVELSVQKRSEYSYKDKDNSHNILKEKISSFIS